jgi:predicted  nucleic acid-binding Zn-ribbon protein
MKDTITIPRKDYEAGEELILELEEEIAELRERLAHNRAKRNEQRIRIMALKKSLEVIRSHCKNVVYVVNNGGQASRSLCIEASFAEHILSLMEEVSV